MTSLRQFMGEVLRSRRIAQGLTLRDVSAKARVSLGYISEVERGQKEASSELLAALCAALEVPLSSVLVDVSSLLEVEEGVVANVSDLSAMDRASMDRASMDLPSMDRASSDNVSVSAA